MGRRRVAVLPDAVPDDAAPGGVPADGRPRPQMAGGLRPQVTRATYRNRYAARPLWVMGVVAAAGWGWHYTVGAAVPAARSWWWIALAASILAVLIREGGRRGEVKPPRRHRVYAAACILSAGVWLATAMRFGFLGLQGGVTLFGLAVPGLYPLSALWWKHHERRPVDDRTLPEPEPPDPYTEDWFAHLGGPGGRWAGTYLDHRVQADGSIAYLIVGKRGKHTTGQFLGADARATIASALGKDPDRIVTERPPREHRNGANARLVIVTGRNKMLKPTIVWEGPTLSRETGIWLPALYADTAARCLLYQVSTTTGVPHRTLNEAVCGNMGKGKSQFVNMSIAERLWSGLFVIWYADGQEGASSPALRDHVDWYATRHTETVRMLKAGYRVVRRRQRYNQTVRWVDEHKFPRVGRGDWPGTPEDPFIQIYLDECQEDLADPRVVWLIKKIQRLGPKCGVGVTLVTQEWLVAETGGQSGDMSAQNIRAFAQQGTVAMFKSGSSTNAMALGSWLKDMDPRNLPDEPGWCYLLGQHTRQADAKMRIIPDEDLYQWLELARPAKACLDAMSVEAAGEDYAKRWERLGEYDEDALTDAALEEVEDEMAAALGEYRPGAPTPEQALTTKGAIAQIVVKNGPITRDEIRAKLVEMGIQVTPKTISDHLASFERTGHMVRLPGHKWDVSDRADRAASDAEDPAKITI